MSRLAFLVVWFLAWMSLAFFAAGAFACDLALIIASDVSGSMDQPQKQIVRRGTAAALRHPEVVHALTDGETQVMVVEFASSVGLVADWRPVANSDDLADLAMAVEVGTAPGAVGSATFFGELLEFAAAAFRNVQCDRMVLDIATDGDPHGIVPESAQFLIDGVHTVNVIFVGGTENDMREMHERTRFGWGGFLLPIGSFEEFPEAMRRKLLMEIG
jgi:Ca-activated chloride channel family protein